MAEFYSARGWEIPPLPWTNLSPPFSPSDDAEADSWETQLTRFEEEALHMSLKLMCSVEEARQRTIADAVWREIFWLMPRDRTVTIVVRGGKVSVDIGPACTEATTDAGNVEAAQ